MVQVVVDITVLGHFLSSYYFEYMTACSFTVISNILLRHFHSTAILKHEPGARCLVV